MEAEPRFYTTMEYLAARYDAVGRRMALRANSVPELLAWQHELRAQIRRQLGLDTMRAAPPEPCVTERVQLDGYTRERVVLQTEPGIWMPLYVLVPDGLQPGERRAAVLAPHGHSSAGKMAPAGRRDIPEVAPTIEAHNYDYGVQFVRQGMVAFCPDARGFGERREIFQQGPESYLHGSCEVINHMAIPLGQTLAGMWAWDLMRLIDYVETRPECDPSRIGCGGLSGGGLQILWLAALDERVRCAVISGYYYGYKDALLRLADNCSCNYIPGMWQLADMGDIGALIAPRPLLIETGDADGLNGARGVVNAEEQVAITRRAYELLGAGERLYHHIFAGEHQWSGVKALPWLATHLKERPA
jgi:hypothetical protein